MAVGRSTGRLGGKRVSPKLGAFIVAVALPVAALAPAPAGAGVVQPAARALGHGWFEPNAGSPGPALSATADKSGPRVVALTATPAVVGPAGGVVVVSARTAGGKYCTLRGTAPGVALVYSRAARSCSNGIFRARVVVGPNRGQGAVPARFHLLASKGDGVGAAQVLVKVEPAPGQRPTRRSASTSPVTTTSLPAVPTTNAITTTVPYAVPTTVPGGSGPGATTGTTNPAGGAPATALTTTTPPVYGTPVSASVATSQNWSGYAVTAGPFASAQGTFTVPQLSTSTTCTQHTSEWVGVDGFSVSGSNQDLIQAGVDESVINPYTGTCTPGTVYVVPWWEILPAAETPIPAMSVSAGDTVSVQVSQVSASLWSISLTDQTTGQAFSTQQPYSGPAGSAEWVLEAPVDEADCGGVCQLAPYCATQAAGCGPVVFSSVQATGPQAQWWDISMDQGAGAVSTPSALAGSSFTISYSTVSNAALVTGSSGRALLTARMAAFGTNGAGTEHLSTSHVRRGSGVYQG